MRPVGETEFVAGVAAMSDSGGYGPARICAGIVGFADLTHDRAQAVLEAHIAAGGGRFRGVRHSAAWDADERIGNSSSVSGGGLYRDGAFHAGLNALTTLGLSLDAWLFHPQIHDVTDAGALASGRQHHSRPHRRRAGLRQLRSAGATRFSRHGRRP